MKKLAHSLRIVIPVLLVILISLGVYTHAQAGYGDKRTACEAAGGTWLPDNPLDMPDDIGWCERTCDDGTYQVPVHTTDGSGDVYAFESCPGPAVAKRNPPPVESVVSGWDLDISYGSCGAFLFEPSKLGTVTLTRYGKPNVGGVHFVQSACNLRYVDEDGQPIESYRGFLWVYYDLNAQTAKQWEAGELSLFTYAVGGWSACNTSWVDDGSAYGRLACLTYNIGPFGLGKLK